ncbi:UDP-N-acetylmuramoyl-L-alanyl-D-glutamate--2,6-diaminopimelate ligase [Jeotgalibacillus soli]|uniref:UDP-N-acetylmuramoyl-L-alanyl-D-glutamate--2,6-diaminopimelate ligase n=1 Tax=Jeotgalibacillus soli TaxID=889306 RepID=A0A0C2V759_9BACL|nr:UDP-N-acetylmuramoyl-L-alanyl-D-glutamate--2,6-diaminopimelate ligase [Jeotgalibacillus soli]KIL44792.1 UDP-N-acetylmuramoylalanyl-D-glutamate--2,6-diaminopimelate ligase [Jeotgalibacillus soli]
MKLLELLHCLPYYEKNGHNNDPIIKYISHHHKQVIPETLFVALKGIKSDGKDYINEAVAKGAVAIVCEDALDLTVPVIRVKNARHALAYIANHFYQYPSHKMNMVGITGTNGKTTVSHMVQSILQQSGERTGIIGTLYMKQGNDTKQASHTTPDSLLLQRILSEFLAEKVTTTVIEVSSHGLIQGRLLGCDIDIAVFTNITQDHLDYHGTMDNYRWAKSLLFSQLGHRHLADSPKFAILNEDDPFSETLKKATSAHIVTYGLTKEADVFATDIRYGHHYTVFTVHTPKGSCFISIPVVGVFNVYNALAAISTAIVKNLSLQEIKNGLSKMQSVPGRFELVDANQNFTVIVDYAHTPDSLKNVLKAIDKMTSKRIHVVVGCGGDRDRAKRPLMASVACQYATDVIFTSDNPRSESALSIIRDMEEGVTGQFYTVIPDRAEAIEFALRNAAEGDVVLIAGKGHEAYQVIGDRSVPFDDKKIAKEILNALNDSSKSSEQ